VADVPSGLSLTPPRETKKKGGSRKIFFCAVYHVTQTAVLLCVVSDTVMARSLLLNRGTDHIA
jgi:hypothetical protein